MQTAECRECAARCTLVVSKLDIFADLMIKILKNDKFLSILQSKCDKFN